MGTSIYTPKWADIMSPDAMAIAAIATKAHAELPEPLQSQTANVEILIADFPGDDIADDLGLETPFDLLGLFEGKGAARYWTPHASQKKPKLTLFRRAILDYWAENDEPLGDIITHIVISELGHHYGLDEETIRKIEARAC